MILGMDWAGSSCMACSGKLILTLTKLDGMGEIGWVLICIGLDHHVWFAHRNRN